MNDKPDHWSGSSDPFYFLKYNISTSISCHWWTLTTCYIAANVLHTNVW